jgi:hypothetical protein
MVEVSTQIAENVVAKAVENAEKSTQKVENVEKSTDNVEKNVENKENVEENVPKDEFSSKFAALSKREKKIREMESQWKEKETKYAEWEETQKLAKQDPLKFIEKAGLNYEMITDFILNGDKSQESAKVQELETKLASFQEELSKKEMQKQIDEYMNKLFTHIDSNVDKYPIVKATDSHPIVVETITKYYEQTGEELDFDTACQWVENYLEDTEVSRLTNLMKIEKLKSKLGLPTNASSESEIVITPKPEVKKASKPKVKTLSNDATATAPDRTQQSKKPTEAERKAAFIAKLKQQV